MAAVASVIRNRLAAGGYGRTPSEIVHAPYQFSPWNPNPGNDPSPFSGVSAPRRRSNHRQMPVWRARVIREEFSVSYSGRHDPG
jgi:hypothetical protein